MAVTYESAGKVRQKTREFSQSPAIFFALKALFLYLATTKKNPDLAFLPYNATSIAGASGQVLADAATTVYAVYGKKRNTATDAYLVLLDDATDDSGGATDARVSLAFQDGRDELFLIFPNGLDMAAGVVAKAYTDYDGTTDSTAADCPDGYVIVAQR